MKYTDKMKYISRSEETTIENYPEINLEELIHKYGPEGLYDIAKFLKEYADEDVSDAMSNSINY